jgi:hypothetical protein
MLVVSEMLVSVSIFLGIGTSRGWEMAMRLSEPEGTVTIPEEMSVSIVQLIEASCAFGRLMVLF